MIDPDFNLDGWNDIWIPSHKRLMKKMKHSTIFDYLKTTWKDAPEFHQTVHENAIKFVNDDPELKAYRDYIEAGAWGFGERSFVWMWRLIMDAMPDSPLCMEIGVHRGAILALWKILNPNAMCYGISPMDGSGLPGLEGQDFMRDVKELHEHFGLELPSIYKGLSNPLDEVVFKEHAPLVLDILYIDGSHKFEDVKYDIINYSPLVRKGGVMIIDDCANDLHMPWGYFQGIQEVTDAVNELLPPHKSNDTWEFVFNVVHNKIFRKIK